MITSINRAIAKRQEEDEKGFTLIELLVVILIIGVLAAIAIPAFLNQREGAWKSQTESDLKNATIAAESYAVENGGTYESLDTTLLASNGFNSTDGVVMTVAVATDFKSYTLTANHDDLATDYVYSSLTGKITP